MSAKLTVCGGAGEVTGANFLLETGSVKMVFDCGLHQREQVCSPVNYAPFAYDVSTIDFLVISHAHADHIGRVPRFVHEGFKGTILSTNATKDLTALMLDDALNLMENDPKCEPLYERKDVERAMSLWKGVEYHENVQVGDAVMVLQDAGHILGSAMARVTRNGKTFLYTGDLGNTPEPLLRDTESPEGAHFIVMESVYGDRLHEARSERQQNLLTHIEATRARNGVLLIPSFSLERTQVILSEINALVESGDMEPIPVFLDAPLSIRATEVYRKYKHMLNDDMQARFAKGDDPFMFEGLKVTPRALDSQAIHQQPNPKVIIAGAGMSHGGRIREHEKNYLGSTTTTVLFVGYQSAGSLGRRLQEGASTISIDGETYTVRAHMETLSGYSGHADRDQLLSFVEKAHETHPKVFVSLGETKSASFLAQRITDFLGLEAIVPTTNQSFEIEW